MTAGSYCYIGPQGIVHGTMVCDIKKEMHTHNPLYLPKENLDDLRQLV